MANDRGTDSFLGSNLARFLDGASKVGENQRKDFRRGFSGVQVEPAKSPRINLPGFDQTFKLGPGVEVTDQDKATYWDFKRRGLDPPLDPAVTAAIERKREMADNIRNSAIPEYQQGIAQMMNAVDNVQDAALTLAVVGRIAMRLGGVGAAAAAPWLAPILTAVALLDALTLGLSYFGPAYALYCGGPRDAAAALLAPKMAAAFFGSVIPRAARRVGLPSAVPPAQRKGALGGAAMAGIGNRRGRANGGLPQQFAWTKASEALQAAQVGADFAGYGLQLGAIMGFFAEVAYSTARAQRGEAVGVRSPDAAHRYAALLRPVTDQLSAGALWHRHTCAKNLATAWVILMDPETWGPEVYALAWATVYTSQEPLAWDQQGLDWQSVIMPELRQAWPAFAPVTVADRLERQGLGLEIDRAGAWPVAGAGESIDSDTLLLDIGPKIARGLERFLAAYRHEPVGTFVDVMAGMTCERLWCWVCDHPHFPQWEMGDGQKFLECLLMASRWPALGDPPERLWDFYQRVTARQGELGRVFLDAEELDHLGELAGTPLIRIVPGDRGISPGLWMPTNPDGSTSGPFGFGSTVEDARADANSRKGSEAPF